MKGKIILPKAILAVLVIAVFTMMPISLAGLKIEIPTNQTNHSGAFTLTMTYVNNTDIKTAIAGNSTCYNNASGTWAAFSDTITVNEATTAGSNITMTASITASMDTDGAAVNCSLGNETVTNVTGGGEYVHVNFDSTDPIIQTLDFDRESATAGRIFKYSSAISDALTGVLSQSCNITDPEGGITTTTIPATNELFEINRLVDAGTYTFACEVEDYAGNNVSNSVALSVDEAGNVKRLDGGLLSSLANKSNWLFIIIAAVVVFLWLKKRNG